jgi:hypothetical protein
VLLLTKLFYGSFGQVSPIISDDDVRIAKTKDQLLQKLDYYFWIAITDRLSSTHLVNLSTATRR